jgi:C4-dicarboxylate-specific signal transduction histidine kinase
MSLFRDQIESHRALLFQQANLENVVDRRTSELSRTNAQLQIEIDERNKALTVLRHIEQHLTDAGIGTISEIFDGETPHPPRGCIV